MEHFFRLTTRSLASRLQVNSHDRPLWRQMQLRMNLSTLQLRSRKPADLTVTDEFFGEKSTIWNDTAWPKKAVKATSTTVFIFSLDVFRWLKKGQKKLGKKWRREAESQDVSPKIGWVSSPGAWWQSRLDAQVWKVLKEARSVFKLRSNFVWAQYFKSSRLAWARNVNLVSLLKTSAEFSRQPVSKSSQLEMFLSLVANFFSVR